MGQRILVAEDEMVIAFDLRDTVEEAGYEVEGPYAGTSSALRACEGKRPDLAILDVSFGGDDSFRLQRLDGREDGRRRLQRIDGRRRQRDVKALPPIDHHTAQSQPHAHPAHGDFHRCQWITTMFFAAVPRWNLAG